MCGILAVLGCIDNSQAKRSRIIELSRRCFFLPYISFLRAFHFSKPVLWFLSLSSYFLMLAKYLLLIYSCDLQRYFQMRCSCFERIDDLIPFPSWLIFCDAIFGFLNCSLEMQVTASGSWLEWLALPRKLLSRPSTAGYCRSYLRRSTSI